MSYFQAIIMGIVQGTGEFLPISSSGHLVIMPWLMSFADPGLTFDVALHLGTLLAVILYFKQDWLHLLAHVRVVVRQIFQREPLRDLLGQNNTQLILQLLVATLPAALIGALFDDFIEATFRHPLLIAFDLIFWGAILLVVDRRAAQNKELTRLSLSAAFLIGLAQTVALLPGSSRSGMTMMAALVLGLARSDAARFSFLLSMPITLGACLLKSGEILKMCTDPVALTGMIVSFGVGLASIHFLIKIIKRYSLSVFCYYRFALGVLIVLLYWWRHAV